MLQIQQKKTPTTKKVEKQKIRRWHERSEKEDDVSEEDRINYLSFQSMTIQKIVHLPYSLFTCISVTGCHKIGLQNVESYSVCLKFYLLCSGPPCQLQSQGLHLTQIPQPLLQVRSSNSGNTSSNFVKGKRKGQVALGVPPKLVVHK